MSSSITIFGEKALVNGTFQPGRFTSETGLIAGTPADSTIHFEDDAILLPGLINAHDHLEFNSFPVLGRQGAYLDMYQWAAEIEGQLEAPAIRSALKIPFEDRLRIGGLKNLLSGVTTVGHHNAYHPCFERRFPVRVVKQYAWSHSPGLDSQAAATQRRTHPDVPWIIHAGEGISDRASREIDEMAKAGQLAPNTVIVHAIGATAEQLELVVRCGAGIISCPASNRFLYGRTLDFAALPAGLRLALGSDSAASSSSGLLEDLRLMASAVDWTEEKLWSLVTGGAAEMLRLSEAKSDLVALRDHDPVLVIIGGRIRLAGEELRHLCREGYRPIRFRGREKWIAEEIELPWRSAARAAEWTPYLRELVL